MVPKKDSPANGKTMQAPPRALGTSRGLRSMGRKVVIFGSGGCGKTKLVSLLKQVGVSVLVADVEEGSSYLDVTRVDPTPATFEEVRAVLHNDLLSQFDAVCIDSLTKLEEYATAYVLANIPHEKGHMVSRIEDFGYGKGYSHIYEAMLLVLGDLDRLSRMGKHVICVCHDCTETVPNPAGENYLQYQPRLQSPPKAGKLRERVREWADDLCYIGWDLIVTKDGKAQGSGSRTIYPIQLPSHWAKSRTLSEPIPYIDNDPELWRQLQLEKE
jgi:hypothetical protein